MAPQEREEEQQEQGFVVSDKRLFTKDGERRETEHRPEAANRPEAEGTPPPQASAPPPEPRRPHHRGGGMEGRPWRIGGRCRT